MKEDYVNGWTGEPFYTSPEHEPADVKSESSSITPQSWLTFDHVVLTGVSIIGSIIGTMIGVTLCTLIQ